MDAKNYLIKRGWAQSGRLWVDPLHKDKVSENLAFLFQHDRDVERLDELEAADTALRARVEALEADAARLQWVLRHGVARTLGAGADDFDYQPITIEMIDSAMARAALDNTEAI